jgi:hypothetical protein
VAATGEGERGRRCKRAGSGGDREAGEATGGRAEQQRGERSGGEAATESKQKGIDTVTGVDSINNNLKADR